MKSTNDINKVSELNREAKIDFLNRIKDGEIDHKKLSSQSVIIQDGQQAFTGLMVSVAYMNEGKVSPVIYIGEAKKMIEEAIKNIQEKRQEKTK